MIDTPTDDICALRAVLPAPDVEPMSSDVFARVEQRIRTRLADSRPELSQRKHLRTGRGAKAGVLVAAAAAVVALVPAVLPGGHADRTFAIGASPAAAQVLDEAASVALGIKVTAPREDQWVYVRSVWSVAEPKNGDSPREVRDIWLSQQPEMKNGATQYSVNGSRVPILYDRVVDGYVPADINRPTYAWFASLPTNPDELKQRLIDDSRRIGYYRTDADLFRTISDIVSESIIPPQVQAALYRVLMRIQGVAATPNVADAAGRRGIGVTVPDAEGLATTSLIFDDKTHGLLGTRTEDDASAVLRRAVVDHRYAQPAP